RFSSSRLKLLLIAPTFGEKAIPPVRFSDIDAKDLNGFLKRHLVSPADGLPIDLAEDDPIVGIDATTARVREAIEALTREELDAAARVVVEIQSHFIIARTETTRPERKLVASDGRNVPPSPGIVADDLAKALGAIATKGCKVLVLLDGVHTASSPIWDTDVTD